jgi:hypothetical protein
VIQEALSTIRLDNDILAYSPHEKEATVVIRTNQQMVTKVGLQDMENSQDIEQLGRNKLTKSLLTYNEDSVTARLSGEGGIWLNLSRRNTRRLTQCN